jgi:hypothetical protein
MHISTKILSKIFIFFPNPTFCSLYKRLHKVASILVSNQKNAVFTMEVIFPHDLHNKNGIIGLSLFSSTNDI